MLPNLQGTEAGKMQLFSEELLGLPARGVAQHRAGYWDCHFHIRHLAWSAEMGGTGWAPYGMVWGCGCGGCSACFVVGISHWWHLLLSYCIPLYSMHVITSWHDCVVSHHSHHSRPISLVPDSQLRKVPADIWMKFQKRPGVTGHRSGFFRSLQLVHWSIVHSMIDMG